MNSQCRKLPLREGAAWLGRGNRYPRGLDLGVIPRSVFTMLVLMTVVDTVITSPVLKRGGISRGLALPDKA
jgi:hypothetical protein